MDRLEELLGLSPQEKRARGVEHTAREIRQQPDAWRETARVIQEKERELSGFLDSARVRGNAAGTVLLMGAGSSEYAGRCAEDALRRGLETIVVTQPTTTFLTHPRDAVAGGRTNLFIHFARSGDSPESVASYERALSLVPGSHHLVITCNESGRLAVSAAARKNTFVLVLPERTNDRSLVMTSSFTSMTLAAVALARLGDLDAFRRDVETAASAVEALFARDVEQVRGFAEEPASRIQYLGTGNLHGAMMESRLKVLEMTDGQVAANVDTFLGIRHGPRVFIDRECLVAASLSTDAARRAWEMDLLGELRASGQGRKVLVICGPAAAVPGDIADIQVPVAAGPAAVPQDLRPLTDVVVGQLIGLFACLSRGRRPDAPSRSGVISRVVPGFALH